MCPGERSSEDLRLQQSPICSTFQMLILVPSSRFLLLLVRHLLLVAMHLLLVDWHKILQNVQETSDMFYHVLSTADSRNGHLS